MIGRVFGQLTVLERSRLVSKRGYYYHCTCSCGNVVEKCGSILKQSVKLGRNSSCGCKRAEILKDNAQKRIGQPRNDLTGKQFGFLKVIRLAANQKNRPVGTGLTWVCKCICGGRHEVPGNWLTTGNTKSCGCRGILDLTGKQLGKIKVLSKTGKGTYECKCMSTPD